MKPADSPGIKAPDPPTTPRIKQAISAAVEIQEGGLIALLDTDGPYMPALIRARMARQKGERNQ